MKKIGIYGGTFDPIHNGHMLAAENFFNALKLDKLILVPAGAPPHKQGDYRRHALHRLEMVKLALCGTPFEASDFETLSQGKSYTYKTLSHFKNIYKDSALYLLMGDEAYSEFETWRYPDKIREMAKIVVIRRAGEFKEDNSVLFIDEEPFAVSSREIREKLSRGEDISGLVPEKVCGYIEKNNLYRGDQSERSGYNSRA